jgi:hypothetical protein
MDSLERMRDDILRAAGKQGSQAATGSWPGEARGTVTPRLATYQGAMPLVGLLSAPPRGQSRGSTSLRTPGWT